MPKDEKTPLVDKDSRDELGEVRQGKPRKFVMICKGNSIVSLVVYKQGSLDNYIKQAKQLGTGQPYHGVVDGRGNDIRFKLATADGFKEEPVKTLVLKSFLEDEADFKCKPEFEIVAEQSESSAPPAPPAPPPPPVTAPDRKLAASVRQLGPTITQAKRAYPERKADIDKLKTAIDLCVKSNRVDEGKQVLAQLEKLLNSLGSVDPLKAEAFREQWDAAVDAWEAAVATVRAQLAVLQTHLVRCDDEELQTIGEFGMNAVTQKHLVPLAAALMELDATGADRLKTAAKRVQNLVAEFRKHVAESPIVAACDQNPFDVPVTIRQTLEPGFAALERGLQAVTAG